MKKRTHRRLTSIVLVATALAPAALFAQPASAFPKGDAIYNFKYKVKATSYIKKANLTMSPPPGIFKGGIDLNTGKLKGSITIPPTTFTQSEAGVGLVTATAAIEAVGPTTGTVNIGTFKVTSTSVFNIHILSMYPANPLPPVTLPVVGPVGPPPVNLVGKNCKTQTPVHVTISGVAKLGAASKFTGVFTLPPFANCQAMTTVLNQEIPGPGNTFTAVATPAS